MPNFVRSFRMRIISLFISSLLIAAAITFGIYKLLQYYYHNNVYYGDTYMYYRQIMRNIGDIYVFMIIYIPLSIIIFYLLTRRYTKYFNEISLGIRHLASGHFGYFTNVPSRDEFQRIASDINEASMRLKQAIESQELSQRSKEVLVANLTHDLRTPLTSVIGYLQLLQQDESLSDDKKKEYLRIAFNKSQYLEELIESLFDISKLDLALNSADFTPINLHELLLQLIDEMYPVVEETQATIEHSFEYNLITLGNGKELARVFENLLSNALRYGNMEHPIRVKGYKSQHSIHIEVINAGNPIADKDLPHLFDAFYTVDQSRTMVKKQTGLGLYIAKTIVEKHNGTIEVWNNELHTHFMVTLPQRKI